MAEENRTPNASYVFESEKIGVPVRVAFTNTIHGGDITIISLKSDKLTFSRDDFGLNPSTQGIENFSNTSLAITRLSEALGAPVADIGDPSATFRTGRISQNLTTNNEGKFYLSVSYVDNSRKSEEWLDKLVNAGVMNGEQRQQAQATLNSVRTQRNVGTGTTVPNLQAPITEQRER